MPGTWWYQKYTQVGSMEMEMIAVPDIEMIVVPHVSPVPPDTPPAHSMQEAELHWTVLPALQEPNTKTMRGQANCGNAFVFAVIAVCVGTTHTAVALGSVEGPLLFLLLGAVWTAAIGALVCLTGLMFGDPGVITRSEERCKPIPHGLIREQLLAGQGLSSAIRNYDDPTHGSYCVRCLIWRRTADKAHHCSICQRCGMYM